MTSPLAITRIALLTPFGFDTWSALLADRRLSDNSQIPDALLDPDLAADTTLDRSLRLALTVARRALPSPAPPDTALFCATSKGPITTWLAALDTLAASQPLSTSQAAHLALGAGAMSSILAKRLHLRGTAHTSVAACASGMHALHRAARAVARGEAPRALVVAADASLHPLFTASFTRLGVLAPADENGIRRCEPFSAEGAGFFLTEAAAAILIEAHPTESPLAWIEEARLAADSTGLIALDPAGHSLRHLLQHLAELTPAFLHAHATGTAHDAHELAALRSAFPSAPVFSHKRWLGHSLGAAGLVSIALSALAHHHRITPLHTPVPPGSRSLTLAQGFGGHIALTTLRSA
ncbi:MAG TPA: beta-ketoacyl synthase N-terminal-like domain-containing protein [Phycisphaerae bacterium]|nr:beta-ketoacyl synthase N-terminal-like domain-containing protein [Phycisphaerae bacterium]